MKKFIAMIVLVFVGMGLFAQSSERALWNAGGNDQSVFIGVVDGANFSYTFSRNVSQETGRNIGMATIYHGRTLDPKSVLAYEYRIHSGRLWLNLVRTAQVDESGGLYNRRDLFGEPMSLEIKLIREERGVFIIIDGDNAFMLLPSF